MRIGILGSGVVGQTLGSGLINLGYEIKLGTRDPSKLKEWQEKVGSKGSVGSFSDAAKFGEVVFIATKWDGTENAINLAGKENFAGKIVVDVTNTLDFSTGKLTLHPAIKYPKSASQFIKEWAGTKAVVKAFNIIPAHVMTNPKQFSDGVPDLFIAGDDEGKDFVKEIAKKWGWHDVIDMGGMNATFWLDMMGMISVSYGVKYNDWKFAYKFLRK